VVSLLPPTFAELRRELADDARRARIDWPAEPPEANLPLLAMTMLLCALCAYLAEKLLDVPALLEAAAFCADYPV
jgi:hypothetical protein